jgi:hypothetical protein
MGTAAASPRLALQRDINTVYRDGLAPNVGRDQLPALSALAETVHNGQNTGDVGYYASIIETLLHRAIDVAASTLTHRSTPHTLSLKLALRELFDIGKEHEHISGIEQRLAIAADILGYKSMDTFRKAKRGSKKFTALACQRVTSALVTIAKQYGFTYKASPLDHEPARPWLDIIIERQLLPDGERALEVFYTGRTIYDELNVIFTEGFETVAVNPELIPTIAAISQLATANGDSTMWEHGSDNLETILTWALDQPSSVITSRAACELLGLGDARGLDIDARLERAAAYQGFENADRFIRSGKVAIVMTFLRDQLLILTAEMEHFPLKILRETGL